MSKTFVLSNFNSSDAAAMEYDAPSGPQSDDAYESGYKAGWDDAVRKNSDEADRLTAGLSENLQQIAFDFHQARSAIIEGLDATVHAILEKTLPEIAQAGLAQNIKDVLLKSIEEGSQAPFVLRINPNDRAAVDGILPEVNGIALEIQEATDLGPGQVLFELGGLESSLNTETVVQDILKLSSEFFGGLSTTPLKDAQYG